MNKDLLERLWAELPSRPKRVLIMGSEDGLVGSCLGDWLDELAKSASVDSADYNHLNQSCESQGNEKLDCFFLASHRLDELAAFPSFDVIVIGNAHLQGFRVSNFLSAMSALAGPQTKLFLDFPNIANYMSMGSLLMGDLPEQIQFASSEIEPRFLAYASAIKLLLDCGWLPSIIGSKDLPLPSSQQTLSLLNAAKAFGVSSSAPQGVLRTDRYLISALASPKTRMTADVEQPSVSVVVAVNNETQFRLNANRSPGYQEIGAEIIPVRGARNAAEAFRFGADISRGQWILFAHQDVYLPAGSGYLLLEHLAKLDSVPFMDAPIGFAGTVLDKSASESLRVTSCGCVVDRTQGWIRGSSTEALALDELGILLPKSSSLRIDERLGWHCWATDLCLQAEDLNGYPCSRIIEVPIYHNSVNSQLGISFYESAYALLQKYPQRSSIIANCAFLSLPAVRSELRRLRAREAFSTLRWLLRGGLKLVTRS